MRLVAVLLLVCFAASPSAAQELERPKKLAGFLKPEMCLGIRAFDETNGIKLTVYSPKDFEIARDARTIGLDDLAKKYPKIKRLRYERLNEYAASLDAKRDELPPDKELGEPRIELSVDRRELLCNIEHVGEDYILVVYGDGLKTRRLFATSYISTIRWQETTAWRFTTSVREIPKTKDRTTR